MAEDGLYLLIGQLERGLEGSGRRRAAANAITTFCNTSRLPFQEHVPSLILVCPLFTSSSSCSSSWSTGSTTCSPARPFPSLFLRSTCFPVAPPCLSLVHHTAPFVRFVRFLLLKAFSFFRFPGCLSVRLIDCSFCSAVCLSFSLAVTAGAYLQERTGAYREGRTGADLLIYPYKRPPRMSLITPKPTSVFIFPLSRSTTSLSFKKHP